MTEYDRRTISRASHEAIRSAAEPENCAAPGAALSAYDVLQARRFAEDGSRDADALHAARRVLSVLLVPLAASFKIVPGRGWISSDDPQGNTRQAFVELHTPSSAPQVLATVGVESYRDRQILAVRVAGDFVEEFPWDGPPDWERAQARAEELVAQEKPAT